MSGSPLFYHGFPLADPAERPARRGRRLQEGREEGRQSGEEAAHADLQKHHMLVIAFSWCPCPYHTAKNVNAVTTVLFSWLVIS